MITSLRRSFATKLTVGGCVVALVVVGGVAAYLIYSRTTQTAGAAQSNADNRVGVMAEVLDRYTGVESFAAAASLAAQAPLAAALSSADPAGATAALFSTGPSVGLEGEVLVIADAGDRVVYTRAAPSVGSTVSVQRAPRAMRVATGGGRCARGSGATAVGGCGIELLGDGQPAYVVALPVSSGGHPVGAVAYVAPLTFQLDRFEALFNFPTAFVAARSTGAELRPSRGRTTATPVALRNALRSAAPVRRAIYDAPTASGTTATVAGSFMPVYGADGALTGYVGIEVPLAPFVGDERTDVLAVALIAVFVLLLVTLAVVLFVDRFVKRPIAQLEHGVARIAGGDYSTGITVRSQDELGRLAASVNTMRLAIAGYVRQVEWGRARLDHAVEQVSRVSRALTTTTAGVPGLEQAVVDAAALIGGAGTAALLATRRGESLLLAAANGSVPPLSEWPGLDRVLTGRAVTLEHGLHGRLLAVPMYYQGGVVGALATITPSGDEGGGDELDVLAVLANSAAIAMENARLYEQERETVRRLLELDSLKTDFLSTVQHELRTPLTAIVGLADLLEMCWDMWDDTPKVSAVRDIQVAAKNLYDIVETIIDYSALTEEGSDLRRNQIPLRALVMESIESVRERYREGLPVPVDVEGDERLTVFADRDRLAQVMRAIVDNGLKFGDGRGRLRIRFGLDGGGRDVRIEVADQGDGIPEERLPQVFDPFFQVDNSATRQHDGTGMGLALVKRVVAAHGATVEVQSAVGKGTAVILHWPSSPRPGPLTVPRVETDPSPGGGPALPAAPVQ